MTEIGVVMEPVPKCSAEMSVRIENMGFDIPQDVTAFLVLGAISETEIANEEIIGILTIAWRCLYAEITAARLDGRRLNLERAPKKSVVHDTQ